MDHQDMKSVTAMMRTLKGYLGMNVTSVDVDSEHARALKAEHHMASQLDSAAWYMAAMHEKLLETPRRSLDYQPALDGYLQAKIFHNGLQDGAILAGRNAATYLSGDKAASRKGYTGPPTG
jgi:hypothetical protein